ncbi:MAG: NGG1p interacting factor NIF3, partial [Bacteroidia bacterium]|nr:NGG1p interacting factor NIF3 [Bacteroidia bacterium]
MADQYGRRKFINDVSKAAGAAIVITLPGISKAGELLQTKDVFTVKQVIDIILKEVPDFNRPTTVDQLRSGSM